jgi:hypothetical protein
MIEEAASFDPLSAMPSAPIGISEIWIRPFQYNFVPISESFAVSQLLFDGQDLSAKGHWQSFETKPSKSTVTFQNSDGQPSLIRLKVAFNKEDFQTIRALGLPFRYRFIIIIRSITGAYYLCPYQQGMILMSPLWIDRISDDYHLVDFVGHGPEGLTSLLTDIVPGPQPYTPNKPLNVAWGNSRTPLQMIKEAQVSTLG